MPTLAIRPFDDPDTPAVIALWNDVLPPNAPHNDPATSLRMKCAVDRDLLLVATLDDELVGTIMGGWDGHRGWIYSLAVRPEFRNRGIGTALVRKLEALFAERGCLKINLQVRDSNAAVTAFYEKLGYHREPILSLGKRLYE